MASPEISPPREPVTRVRFTDRPCRLQAVEDRVHPSPPSLGHQSPGNNGPDDLLQPIDNEWLKEGLPDTDFNRSYPPDPWGEEVSDNARVWKLYRDQLDTADKGMLETWNKTLDVLLIFAGLFSAVLTAFLLEAYKSLQPDYMRYIAAFLYDSAANNVTAGNLFSHDVLLPPDKFTQTTRAQRLTNGLWFLSLFVSLAVALLSILLKQWLDEYQSHISASAPSLKYWARRHQLYSAGMQKWGLPSLISCLPTLLHFSVFLFFVGLVLFLQPLDAAIAYALLGFVFVVFMFYLLSLVMPAWHVDCPSYTPLLRQMPGLGRLFLGPLRYFSSKLEPDQT
ncbi:hypothetical protein AURDEDRAFT_156456 [Auricularia subglabra TFB-10046 SS5]|nr:hypothetical protein AURDEDRAFT_156456 [Auricularia subglabra TFB-10046 SS5]